MRSTRLQPDHVAIAALALLAVVFWGNCLWGGEVPVAAIYQKQMLPWSAVSQAGGETRQWDSLLWDSMAQFYPWRVLLHNAAQKGELPLWNPYQFCGYPFVGNGQSAMFYPPNWLYFIIHPKLGMGLSAALHFFLGSLFVFGLARTWRLSTIPATFAAVAFTYGGFMVTWVELPTLVNSLIWLPLAWWGIELIFRCGVSAEGPNGGRSGPHPAHRASSEAPHAEQHPASGPLTAATAPSSTPPTYCHPECNEGPRRASDRTRGLLMLGIALGMTLLAGHFQIAAYVWIFAALYTIIRLLASLPRVSFRRLIVPLAIAVALGGALAATQVLPTLELGQYSARGAGGPSAAGFEFHRQRALQPIELFTLLQADFLGTPVDGTYRGISYSEHCPFVGATTILLGLLGLALSFRRKHHYGRLWLFFAIAIFALWGAMAGPPAMLLYWGVPKLGQAGGFSRLLSVWTLAAALWGASGLQVLLDCISGSSASSVGRGLVPRRPSSAPSGDIRLLASAGRSAALDAAPQPDASASGKAAPPNSASAGRSAAGPIVAALALILLALELFPWAYRFNPRADAASVYPETAAIQKLRELSGPNRYVAVNDRRNWGLAEVPTGVVMPPNAATVYGLRCVDGYDSLFPLRYRQHAAAVEGADPSPLANGNMLLLEKGNAWGRDACPWVVSSDTLANPVPGAQAVWQGDGVRVSRVPYAPSRAQLINVFSSSLKATPIPISGDRLNSVRLDLSSRPRHGRFWALTLHDAPYPGWHAFANGQETQLVLSRSEPVAPVSRSLEVTAGTRTADLVYFPASVACGLFITLLAFAALTALGASRLRRCAA